MEQLFQTRRNRHLIMLSKYWRLVFNDHFIIALFFMVGALAFSYSQLLDQLSGNIWWAKPVIMGILVVGLQFGRLATLVERPDPIFLLPQSRALVQYLNSAKRYSTWLSEIMMVLIGLVLSPWMARAAHINTVNIGLLLATAILLKVVWMNSKVIELFGQERNLRWLNWGSEIGIIGIGLWLNTIVAVVLAVALVGYSEMRLRRSQTAILNWRLAVKTEAGRMQTVYQFFNLFTDVPAVQGATHRRGYLDWIVNWLGRQSTVYGYLFSRGFVRGGDISGLWLRLTIVGAVLIFFIPLGWLNIVLFLLFIYLISVQLVPLFTQFDNSVFTHIYPVKVAEKQTEFRRLTAKALSISMLILLFGSTTLHPNWQLMLIKLLFGIAEVVVLNQVYLKNRISSSKRGNI